MQKHQTMDSLGVWRRVSIVLLFVCGCFACVSTPSAPRPKAVFIIVDGIPADVVERVATPVFDEIAGAGGYAHAYVGGTPGTASESPTMSAVGYNSLLTGTWANKHNVYDNKIDAPDYRYWDIFRIARHHDPALKTAIFSTWLDNRTKLVGDGIKAAGGHKLDYYFDGFEHDTLRFPHDDKGEYIGAIDRHVAAEAARYIENDAPDLSWVYLEYTDAVAHLYGDSAALDAAVHAVDGLVGKIWSAVKKRERDFGEEWLIVVTTDHGRDATGGKHHGGQSERERLTWIVTNSRRLNVQFYRHPAIVDILPSIAKHLGLQIPASVQAELDGQSFID